MPNVAENLRRATEVLQTGGIPHPRREAASLLTLALEKDKSFLIAHPEYRLTEVEEVRFQSFVARRVGREPFQRIAGRQEFYGLDFEVTSDVLIPRPETELIVEAAVKILKNCENPFVCEVGVGSGCVSVSLLHTVKTAIGFGLDVSEKAVSVAARNAARHGVARRLRLEISDVFARLENERFDLIASNPPYVPAAQIAHLQPEVRNFEPLVALAGGADGLSIIKRLVRESPKFLKPKSFLLMEIGFTQAATVSRMFDPQIWQKLEILPDLQGIPRVVKAQIR